MTTPPNPSWPPEQDRGTTTPGTPPAGLPSSQPPNYAYGQPGYPGPPMQLPINGLAVASLVLGILWVLWIGSILALIFGYIARNQIKERNEGGAGLAIAGIVLGWVGIGILAFYVIVIITVVAAGP
ncbi:MAG: DUF4190 domain-containing protein [Pseudonocardiaceae bacterium]